MARSTNSAELEGRRFPGGSYRLEPYVAWLWADALGATPDDAIAHPSIAYMLGLHGGGASIGQILELLDADLDSGVQFGEITFEYYAVLRPSQTYIVEGEIVRVAEKVGRQTGRFDRVSFAHRIADTDGNPVATVTHVWIIPRR